MELIQQWLVGCCKTNHGLVGFGMGDGPELDSHHQGAHDLTQ